jgi:hypothetical protein
MNPYPVFFMKLVGLIHTVRIIMLEFFPILGFDALAQRVEM